MIDMHVKKFTPDLIGLAFKFEVNPFSCGNPDYFSSYIRFSALSDNNSGRTVAHVLLDSEEKNIVGYISLKATALLSQTDVDGRLVYTGEPAVEIAELAVHKDFERQKVGTTLVNLAIATASQLNETSVGVRNLVLAADPNAVKFYERMGFLYMKDYYDMPLESANVNCVKMFMQLYC